MKKIFYIFITFLSITGLLTCLLLNGTHYTFNSSNVKNNIEYLSSTDFKGRLAGSDENYLVANEIEEVFKEYKLEPLNSSYKQGFQAMCPTYTGDKCSLKILDNDVIIKDFQVGKDFKEDLLNFKDTSIKFTKDDQINIYKKSFSITKGNTEYLFCVSSDKDFSFRSSFVHDSPYGFAIQINTDTFNSILDSLRSGYTLDVKLPYTVQQKEIYNIVGKIKGTESNLPPLIITAHYDHVGIDSLSSVYSGALDNASGTAFMLELARTYSSLKLPKRDIIFVALNAEEFGLLGSQAFADKYKDEFVGAEVINFDMIGAENYPITFMEGTSNKNKCSNLLEDLKYICNSKEINNTTSYQDASDHVSFINNGFDSLTVTHADVSNIHTPKDTSEKISPYAIDSVYDIINSKILDYAYNDFSLLLYSPKLLIFFSLSSFGFIGIGFINIKNNHKKNSELSI